MNARAIVLCILIFSLTAGCAAQADRSLPAEIQSVRLDALPRNGAALTESCAVLERIWTGYKSGERFAVFGGTPEKAVADGPGDLEIGDAQTVADRFFLTREQTAQITEGAALEHLLNRNVFCAAVFCLAETVDPVAFSRQLRDSLENVRWSYGMPQRFLIALPEKGFVLMAFGQTGVLDTFLIRMSQAFPQGKTLYYEEIAQKRGQ